MPDLQSPRDAGTPPSPDRQPVKSGLSTAAVPLPAIASDPHNGLVEASGRPQPQLVRLWAPDDGEDPELVKKATRNQKKPDEGGLGPFEVKISTLVHRISNVDATTETFNCRFALHMSWIDPYYQDPDYVKDVTPELSTHPQIGMRAVPFPADDLSIHGLRIPCDDGKRPRWIPEIKFFNAEMPPEVIREEYAMGPHPH